jgi:hypothetical protein
MGQPSEGMPLQNKKWPLRQEITPGQKKVAHSALEDKLKNLFTSSAYQAQFDKNIYERDGQIRQRVCLNFPK